MKTPGTVLLFPGQGAQAVGMGKQLYDTLPAAKALFDRANEVLGYDLADVCFNGPAEKLDSTVHSQPALLVASPRSNPSRPPSRTWPPALRRPPA
jgi:malonyl CoA-acyl carrier protein transacylase